MKEKLRRSMAVLLVIVNMLGNFPAAAYAEGESSEPAQSLEITGESLTLTETAEDNSSVDAEDNSAEKTEENSVSEQEAAQTPEVSAEEKCAFDQTVTVYFDDGSAVNVQVTAAKGVYPKGAVLSASRIDDSDGTYYALAEQGRGAVRMPVYQQFISLRIVDANGAELAPDTSCGQTNVSFGLSVTAEGLASELETEASALSYTLFGVAGGSAQELGCYFDGAIHTTVNSLCIFGVEINAPMPELTMLFAAAPTHTHTWDNGTQTTAPDCVNDGVMTYVCTDSTCGEKMTKTVTALGHDFYVTVTPASCTVDGVIQCTRCSATKPIPATGHNYSETLAPTCTTAGEKTCSGCGDKKPVAALGHDFSQWSTSKAATCFDEGEESRYCLRSGCSETEKRAVASPGHRYTFSKTEAPTCTTDGYDEYICSVCNAVAKDNPLSALGHDYSVENRAPSCCQDGDYDCSRCGAKDPNPPKATGSHVWDNGQFTKQSTCTTSGEITHYCLTPGCNASYIETIPSMHIWDNWYVSKNPGCGVDGEEKRECSVCRTTETRAIPAADHPGWNVISNTATCTEDGIITSECTACSAKKQEVSALTGHNFLTNDWTVTKQPTCTDAGEQEHQCTNTHSVVTVVNGNSVVTSVRCTEKEVQTIPAKGHTIDASTGWICSDCGKTFPAIQELIDLLNDIPPESDVNTANAQRVKNLIDAFRAKEQAVTDADELSALNALVVTMPRYPELNSILAKTAVYLNYTTYQTQSADNQSFTVYWNDNSDAKYRQAWATDANVSDFLDDAGVQLSYQIKDANGKVVKSGVLPDTQTANSEFGFLGGNVTNLVDIKRDNLKIIMSTNDSLPKKYTQTYTNYSTGETVTETCTIEYSVTMKNPSPQHYAVTSPTGASSNNIVIPAGGSTILTVYNDYEATISWLDDHNRSANGGNSTANTPRPSADTLKANSKVYVYTEGYNVSAGTLVTSDYTLTVDPKPNSEDYTVKLAGLPAYDNEGNPLAYYIVQDTSIPAANADVVPGNRYTGKYVNEGNYASKTNGLYDGGKLTETLYNTVPFTVNKVWIDDKDDNPSARPSATMSIWSTLDGYDAAGNSVIDKDAAFPVPHTIQKYDVPKSGGTITFMRYFEDGTTSTLFPMYDEEGRKYVYFGKESAISGYTTTISFDKTEPQNVIDAFTGTDYLLRGATVTNTANNITNVPLSKSFSALAIQNKISPSDPITATFLLQMKDATGKWVTAPSSVVLSMDTTGAKVTADTNGVQVTLSNFSAENSLTDSYNGLSLNRFTTVPNGQGGTKTAVAEYRWIELSASVNGVSATYSDSNWTETATGLSYNGDIVVNDGQTSTVLKDASNKTSGPNDTTAIFNAVADKSNNFTNQLVGKTQIDVKKYWYDKDGKNISGDPSLAGTTLNFDVLRDGVKVDTITLSQADLTNSLTGECWEKLMSYDRYDAQGREYRYKLTESASAGSTFVRSENYTTSIVEYPAGSGILMPRMNTVYVNAPGPGNTLYFDVEKVWLDDSDLETRNPVVVDIYRFRTGPDAADLLAQPELVKTVTLNDNNNWFSHIAISAKDANDVVDNYIALEKGMMVNGKLVAHNPAPSSYTSAQLAQIKEYNKKGYSKTETGTVGSTAAENAAWDGLSYIYRAFAEEKDQDPKWADTVFTNLRIGTQDYKFTKLWNSGTIIRSAKFALVDSNNKEVATFVIDINYDNNGNPIGVNDPITVTPGTGLSIDPTKINVQVVGLNHDAKTGNYSTEIKVLDVPKFDNVGAQIEYHIDELAIMDKNGSWVNVKNGSCVVDGINYSVGYTSSTVYAPNETHRSPDEYAVQISNNVSGSYKLVANKVWRDSNKTSRPDISFSVYRVSAKEGNVAALVNSGNTSALTTELRSYIDSAHIVQTDKYWDTKMNEFWWTCDIGSVARFDSEGYPYVYFAVERINSTNSVTYTYSGYYCNDIYTDSGYRPVNVGGTGYTSKQVFGKDNDLLDPMASSVFILADGVHSGNGGFHDYYSATSVNRVEGYRDVSGKKLWKMPLDMAVDISELPAVTIDLYRLTEEVSVTQYSTVAAYANYIRANGEKITLNSQAAVSEINTSTIDGSKECQFKYTFDKDVNGDKLPRYTEYGETYYYYTLENISTKLHNFPADKVQYSDNDYSINNVFSAEAPYVQVPVQKEWEISNEVLGNLGKYGLPGLAVTDLASAEIDLIGAPLKADGTEIAGMKKTFNSVTLDPAKAVGLNLNQSRTVNGVTYTLKYDSTKNKNILLAEYTFVDFKNTVTNAYEKLPYYWTETKRIDYSLSEKETKGYTVTKTNVSSVVFDAQPGKDADGEVCYFTPAASVPKFLNVYEDQQYKDMEFTKYWDDNYVANDEYRPDKLVFTIKRRVDKVVDPNWSDTVVLEKSKNAHQYMWKGKLEHLIKYNPDGKEYDYFIESETFYNANGANWTQVGNALTAVNDQAGYYRVSGIGTTRFTNKIIDGIPVSVEKTWTIDGKAVTDYTNANGTGLKDLWDMGALPVSITFMVEKKDPVSGSWSYVPASTDSTDALHKVKVGTNEYLGRTVVLGTVGGAPAFDANNFKDYIATKVTWQNLPKNTVLNQPLEYRVIEILNWADGTVTRVDTTNVKSKNITSGTTTSGDSTKGFVTAAGNDVGFNKAKIAKVWDDNHGYDNSRPATITVKIEPIDANGKVIGTGHTFTLKTSGNKATDPDSNIYYSDEFALPSNVPVSYGVTGAKYLITETWSSKNGETYVRTITSDNNNVKTVGDTTYLHITNTYTGQKKISVEANKNWSGDTVWQELTRPTIKYVLQYRTQDKKSWVDLDDTTIKDFIVTGGAAQSAVVTKTAPGPSVTGNALTAYYKHTWTDLKKYWEKPSVDGVAEIIEYRVREIIEPKDTLLNWYSTNNSKLLTWSFVEATNEYKGKVFTNTLKTVDLKLKKAWTAIDENGNKTVLSDADIAKLITLKAIPSQLRFVVEYQLKGTSTWTVIPEKCTQNEVAGYVSLDTDTFYKDKAVDTGFNLPRYDSNGEEIRYRVREVAVKYDGDNAFTDINWNSGNTAGTLGNISTVPVSVTLTAANDITFNVNNDYAYVTKKITKTWEDENNRDAKRDDFKFTLFRDGVGYATVDVSTGAVDKTVRDNAFCTVTKDDKNNTWTLEWKYLPKYSSNNRSSEYSYTWAETVPTTDYNPVWKVEADGTVKKWNAGTKTYDTVSALDPAVTTETNAYEPLRGSIEATKNWYDYNNAFDSQPDEIWVKLFYKDGSNVYQPVTIASASDFTVINGKRLYTGSGKTYAVYADANYVTNDGWVKLTATNGTWSKAKWIDVPVYRGTGTKVEYRVLEGKKDSSGNIVAIDNNTVSDNYKVTYDSLDLTVTRDNTTKIENTLETTSLKVTKLWEGELAKFKSVTRPVSVTVEIEWKKDDTTSTWAALPENISGQNTPKITNVTYANNKSYVTVSGANTADSWTKTVTGLPKTDADGTEYQYRITEAYITYRVNNADVIVNVYKDSSKSSPYDGWIAGPYDVEANPITAALKNGTYTVSAKNTLRDGSFEVTKEWWDEDNRDGAQNSITVELYRKVGSGTAQKLDEQVLSSGNNWTYKWTDLAVRANNGTEKVTYYVKEKGESGNKLTVTNNGLSAVYDVVYNTTAQGSTLPDSAPYDVTGAGITNIYEPKRGTLSVEKKWDPKDADDVFSAISSEVYLQLQYKDATGTWKPVEYKPLTELKETGAGYDYYAEKNSNGDFDKWLDVDKAYTTTAYGTDFAGQNFWIKTTKSASWQYKWENLPYYKRSGNTTTPIEYRVIEGEATKTNGVVTAITPISAGGSIGGFTVSYSNDVKLTDKAAQTSAVTNTLKTTKLTVEKKWTNDIIEAKLRPDSVTFTVVYRKQGETAWKNLPTGFANVTYGTAGESTVVLTGKDTDTTWTKTVDKLPLKDANGVDYEYKITEAKLSYTGLGDVTVKSVNGKNLIGAYEIKTKVEQTATLTGPTTVTAENDLELGKLKVKKAWKDENDRDALRTADVEIKLYKVKAGAETADTLISTQKLNAKNSWEYEWKNLPIKNYDGSAAYYYVVETPVTGYTTTYNGKTAAADAKLAPASGTANAVEISVDNVHVPDKGSVKAGKSWNDNNDPFKARPASISFKLQYTTDGGTTWTDVPKGTLDAKGLYPDGGVYTSDSNPQSLTKAASWADVEWRNLPYTSGGKTVEYRVVETAAGYTTAYSPAKTAPNADAAKAKITVTNTPVIDDFTIAKSWTDAAHTVLKPESVTFHVEFSVDGGAYEKMPALSGVDANGNITVNAVGSWTASLKNLPKDTGKNYSYRVSEVSAVYSVNGSSVTVNASGKFDSTDPTKWVGTIGPYAAQITVAKTAAGKWTASAANVASSGSISVSKTWTDETNREAARPQSIEYSLYKVKSGAETADALIETVTVDQSVNWAKTWTGLALKNYDGSDAYYYVVEKAVTGYTTTYNGKTDAADAKLVPATGSASAEIKVDNTHLAEKGSVEADKSWDDFSNHYGIRPAQLTFELFWSVDNSTWSPVSTSGTAGTNANGGVYSTDSNPQTVTVSSSGTKAAWNDLPVYVNNGGTKTKVIYKAVETSVNGYSAPVYTGNAIGITKNSTSTVKVENPIDKTKLSITKSWSGDENYKGLVRPVSVTFFVEYSTDGTNWNAFDSADGTTCVNGEAVMNMNADSTWPTLVISDIPVKDANGSDYEYRVSEAELCYADGSKVYGSGSFTGFFWNGTVGPYTAQLTTAKQTGGEWTCGAVNTREKGSLSVTKIWKDEENRECLRPAKVELKLYSVDNDTLFATVYVDNSVNWTYIWNDLPTKNNDGSDAYYYVVETPVTDYTTEYNTHSSAKSAALKPTVSGTVALIEVTNTHDTEKGSIEAEKTWDDFNDLYNLRPQTLTYELLWSSNPTDASTWKRVAAASTAADNTNGGVYCAEANPQTVNVSSSGSAKALWSDLPVYVNVSGTLTKVSYKVVENDVLYGYNAPDYEVNGSKTNILTASDSTTETVDVTNALEKQQFTLEKEWWYDGTYSQLVRPASVTFFIEYKAQNETTWRPFSIPNSKLKPGTVELSADSNGQWKITLDSIPVRDSNNVPYEYRVSEAELIYADGSKKTATGSFNGLDWAGAAGEYSATVETKASATGNSWSAKAKNVMDAGSLKVKKVWHDSNNRDGLRTQVTLQLYRDGVKFDVPRFLDDTTNWETTWSDLPVYKDADQLIFSEYYVEENVMTDYTALYKFGTVSNADPTKVKVQLTKNVTEEMSVVNTHDQVMLEVECNKRWIDGEDFYGFRPASIELKLEWTIDDPTDPNANWSDLVTREVSVPDPEFDTGNYVFTTSPTTQIITSTGQTTPSVWIGAKWSNLPAYKLVVVYVNGQPQMQSKLINYRIAEPKMPVGYQSSQLSDKSAHYDANVASWNYMLWMENILDPAEVTVEKLWSIPTSTLKSYNMLPDSITVKLQASADNGVTWFDVYKNATYTIFPDASLRFYHKFTGLTEAFIYRVVEVSMNYPNGLVSAIPGASPNAGTIGNFTYSTQTIGSKVTQPDGTQSSLYSNLLTNNVIPTEFTVLKVWDDDADKDGYRRDVTVNIYRDDDGVGNKQDHLVASVVLSAANGYKATVQDLPMYKNVQNANGTLDKSVYTVEEIQIKGYDDPKYSAAYVTFTDAGKAEITVTNKRTRYPHTADLNDPVLYAYLMGTGLLGMAGTGIILVRKKREEE